MMAKETIRAIQVALQYVALPLTIAGIAIAAILLMPTKERPTMIPSSTPAETTSGIPAIDLNAPAQTETATFAMG